MLETKMTPSNNMQNPTVGTASSVEAVRSPGARSRANQVQEETETRPHAENEADASNLGPRAERQQKIPSIVEVGARRRWKLMKKPHMRRANYAAAAVMISQQLCGINLLAFLADTFFRNSIFRDPETPELGDNYRLLGLSLGFGVVNFLATLFAAPYIDVPKKGRRYLLNWSFPLMAGSLLISGLLLLSPPRDESGRAQIVVIAFHYIFLIAFTIVRVTDISSSGANGC